MVDTIHCAKQLIFLKQCSKISVSSILKTNREFLNNLNEWYKTDKRILAIGCNNHSNEGE